MLTLRKQQTVLSSIGDFSIQARQRQFQLIGSSQGSNDLLKSKQQLKSQQESERKNDIPTPPIEKYMSNKISSNICLSNSDSDCSVSNSSDERVVK